MAITLNILAHELAEIDIELHLTRERSCSFEDVQLLNDVHNDMRVIYIADAKGAKYVDDCPFLLVVTDSDEQVEGASGRIVTQLELLDFFALLQGIFLKYRRWERAMDASILNGDGLQKLIDISMPMLYNHIDIVDPAMKLLAHSDDELDDPITNNLNRIGFHTEEAIGEFRLDRRFRLWSETDGLIVNTERKISRFPSIVYTFKQGASFSVIVVMICNQVYPGDYICDLFSMFVERVGHYVSIEYSSDKPLGNAMDAFLRDLLDNSLDDAAQLIERGKYVGLEYEGPYCLFYFGLEKSTDIPMMSFAADIAQKATPAITMPYEGGILVICSNCKNGKCGQSCSGGCRKQECPRMRSTIANRLDKLLGNYGRYCVRSSVVSNLSQIPSAYRQSKVAYEHILASGVIDACGSRILRFDDLSVLLMADTAQAESDSLYATSEYRILSSIREHDREIGTNDYVFLRSFLECERRTMQVAELQHMHRNNVKNRIDKIERNYSIDTSDFNQRLNLLLAFKIRDWREPS